MTYAKLDETTTTTTTATTTTQQLLLQLILLPLLLLIYATADEADAYVLQMFFFVFSIRHKNTRQPFSGTAEQIFMKLLPNDSGENGVCIAIPKWDLGPPINFWGLRTTHCTLGGDTWRVNQN